MATIRQIFWKGLALSIAEKATDNAIKNGVDVDREEGDLSLEGALIQSFVWADTPEGGLYWAEIFEEFEEIDNNKNK